MHIQNILDDLREDDLKKFIFHLTGSTDCKQKAIPRGKLEGKDRLDIAELMTDHYGGDEALRVTVDLLKEIGQRQLALQLERSIGELTS